MNSAKASLEKSTRSRRRGRAVILRLVAIALPFFALVALEGLLRLAGIGYPTRFFLPTTINGEKMLRDNPQFGWRFFPRGIARTPEPVTFRVQKEPGTTRIFVFGESAAMGDPEPAFGLPRMLEAIFGASAPSRKVEVINVAMTAINSHVIREIARDCADLDADYWVIYAGNNEVVGPFGGGTVFSAQAPPRWVIRVSLWLNSTRIGQLLGRLRGSAPAEWEGMEMFLKQQVRHDDPRLRRVHENFRVNLQEIVEQGRKNGAKVILCTVAINLRDCPPFASQPGAPFDSARSNEWHIAYSNITKQARHKSAVESLELVDQLTKRFSGTETHAELRFQGAQALLALGRNTDASGRFNEAKEFDTLRFRADDVLTSVVRAWSNAPGVMLIDAAARLSATSSNSIPGAEYFYEHVHLTFDGNYAVARMIFDAIAGRDPGAADKSVATLEDCAGKLGWNEWKQRVVWTEMQKRLRQPPFTGQLGHETRDAQVMARLNALENALTPARYRAIMDQYRTNLAQRPSDWVLREAYADLLGELGDHTNAAAQWHAVAQALPHDPQPRFHLGSIADTLGNQSEAISHYRHALKLNPELVEARNGLALSLASAGDIKEAQRELARAVKTRPRFVQARINLGQILATQGRIEEARAEYEAALRIDSNSAPAHVNLGKILSASGDRNAAAAHYREAVRINPDNAIAHFNLGNALAQSAPGEALRHYKAAVLANPEFAEARYALGLEMARQGQLDDAIEQFSQVVRLRPDFAEGHFNYGVALAKVRRFNEAAAQFRETLRLEPGNAKAKEFLGKVERN